MCCHPFLCNGLEDHIVDRERAAAKSGEQLSDLQRLVHSSGKMVLLDKLLPKLRREGHKVRHVLQEKMQRSLCQCSACAVLCSAP